MTPLPSRWAAAAALAVMLTLSGCAGPPPADYANETPTLDLRQYFNGPMTAHGLFTDRRTFTFSSRTALPRKTAGGSMATRVSSCNR